MPDKHLFEYAVIRVVPKVEREEFFNAGIVLFCKQKNFLDCRYKLDKEKLAALCRETDCDEVERHLQSFVRICRAEREGGAIAALDQPSRFRWLTATRSTVVQSSKVHPGFCQDPEQTLDRLFVQLVE